MHSPSPDPATPAPTRDVFDEDAYLALHPDVAGAVAAGIVGSGWQHFSLHGAREGRAWVAQPDRLAGVEREISPQDEMFAGDVEHYFDVGESARRCLAAALQLARCDPAQVARVLDLPCGHGRVLRFLRPLFPRAEFTACDLNSDGVDFCARVLGARPLPSAADPARIALPATYDVIWCGSLLTHLPRPAAEGFFRFFDRALAPGGLLVVTLHGRHYEDQLASGRRTVDLDPGQVASLLAAYRRDGFGYVDYRGQSGYGFSLMHPTWVMANLLPLGRWTMIGYHEQGWDGRQDVLMLQRPR